MKYLITILALFSALRVAAEPADRPNFVWIISEDNSMHHLKLFNKNGVSTPNIEALAEDGIIFENACSNGAVCSVARSTLLTGCYAPRIGAQYHRRQALTKMPQGLKPFPQYLKEAGYYAVNIGKTDYNVKVNMKDVWSPKKQMKNLKAAQPFFVNYSSLAVCHEGSGHFKAAQMKELPLTELQKHIVVPPHHPDTKIMRYSYAHYQHRIQKADEQIGEIIANLKNQGVYEDSIIFYFGDHGGILPRSKGYAYETGLNAPLVIRVPDKWKHLFPFEKGSRTKTPVNFYDFGPSLIHAAGLPVAKGFDGKPFFGKGITADSLKNRPQFGYADRFDEKYDLVRTLRHGKMKYMRNYQPFNQDGLHNFYRYKSLAYLELREMFKAGKLNEKEALFFQKKAPEALYDLEKDPYELNNLAADPAHAETLKAMRKELHDHVTSMNDLSFFPESFMIEKLMGDPAGAGVIAHKVIERFVDIADLQLVNYAEAKPDLLENIKSPNPWQRYWAVISATYFAQVNKQDQALTEAIKTQLKQEKNLLVQTRCGEYLAHIGDVEAVQVITKAAYASKDPVELNLILNSAAMVYETDPKKFKFDLKPKQLIKGGLSGHRVKYLK